MRNPAFNNFAVLSSDLGLIGWAFDAAGARQMTPVGGCYLPRKEYARKFHWRPL